MIMLLGRRDEPTDAVRDYTKCLSDALARRGIACKTTEIRWDQFGWLRALVNFWIESRAWRGRWVILHYTALMWSRRGFPLALPLILQILKIRKCRVAVMFHDVYAAGDSHWINRARIFSQQRIMRRLALSACRAIVPVVSEDVPWLSGLQSLIKFIPVGANIPPLDETTVEGNLSTCDPLPAVAVFGVPTWPAAQKREVEAIVHSVRRASSVAGELQLLVFGRGAKEAEPLLRMGFSGSPVRLQVEGLRSSAEITNLLCGCDVMLFARGPLSTRRGSGLAALACGLPIVAYRGGETGFPLADAGILFVPQDDVTALGNELARLLLDRELRLRMKEVNLKVFREWFSWDRIANRWIEALDPREANSQ